MIVLLLRHMIGKIMTDYVTYISLDSLCLLLLKETIFSTRKLTL